MRRDKPIIALATPSGSGAIAVIRISGNEAIEIASAAFKSISGKILNQQKSHTIHLGHIMDGDRLLDEVLISVFKSPNSYTGENVVEISCHGSLFIQQEIIQLFLRRGCRTAKAGEFTLRAFLNGKMDLSQAEAVADLIASETEASHQVALQQMRGGFSNQIKKLRDELIQFASLIELELDFAEEDVEFANREQFEVLLDKVGNILKRLIDSFAIGNVIKSGIPVAIVGEPNVGKSTLLNALLNEDRALVSEIAGTTRDTVEDEISIGGFGFRFIDTAGIRETVDVVEGMGIQRTFEKIASARVIIYLIEAQKVRNEIERYKAEIDNISAKYPKTPLIIIANKLDMVGDEERAHIQSQINNVHLLSARDGKGVEDLKIRLLELINAGAIHSQETIITNTRHYNALLKSLEEVDKIKLGLEEDVSGDLLAVDIRQALYYLGEITGEITSDDLLGNIFANFCIGK
ncbi:tRNA uridine-5-carboxymethylaminomethyl(34) synthesis GTPase MnmE [Maribacter aestuarii]|uniref:tRNA uridine-5-carboxymethylaminomethyl(34) synthesis GTPase MnmE n=1 Tax=Maribacter aestuarii TaxID=1130723 RepID=UPI00248B80AE|nr:tRNA uridine-5-carboxymethylaminomethyl(34) synthesis GTPase MnmE [Maribacter aestuarii]